MLINIQKEIYCFGIMYKLYIDHQDNIQEEDYYLRLKEDIKIKIIDEERNDRLLKLF